MGRAEILHRAKPYLANGLAGGVLGLGAGLGSLAADIRAKGRGLQADRHIVRESLRQTNAQDVAQQRLTFAEV